MYNQKSKLGKYNVVMTSSGQDILAVSSSFVGFIFGMSLTVDEDLRVSPHFPVVRQQCAPVAAVFFHCFTRESRQRDENVPLIFSISSLFFILFFFFSHSCSFLNFEFF